MLSARQTAAQPARTPGVWLIGAWFALAWALLELCVYGVQRYLLGAMLSLDRQVVWMVPAAYLALFAVVGAILRGLARRWRSADAPGASAVVFAFLGAAGILTIFHPQLHKLAILALAGGIAWRSSELIAARSAGFAQLARRTIPLMTAAVLLLAAWVNGARTLAQRRAMASLPTAVAGAPNVLLIILDTVRALNLSAYGYARPTTPNLERLARTGVRFDRAVATAPWTLPTHASIFTGRWPHETTADYRTPLDGTHPTVAEALRRRGYLTGGFVANPVYTGRQTGLDRGFIRYEDHRVTVGSIFDSFALGRFVMASNRLRRAADIYELPGRKPAAVVNAQFLDWLDGRARRGAAPDRPFFAFLNYFDAHMPYLPPEPFASRFGQQPRRGLLARLWNDGRPFSKQLGYADDARALRDSYDGAIASLDHHLGELLAELERRGVLANTLLIVTSDHGEEFGEHGVMEHGNSLYFPSLHVPLLVAFPGRAPAGVTVPVTVSVRDIPATILHLVGPGDGPSFPGTSLAVRWAAGAAASADTVLSELSYAPNLPPEYPVSKGDMRSAVSGSLHLILGGDGARELYDLDRDPGERHDLSASAACAAVVERLTGMLRALPTRRTAR